ncbi:MAG TPA: hypothetical protein VGJ44_08805, partial [Kribbellaceae bacterium]
AGSTHSSTNATQPADPPLAADLASATTAPTPTSPEITTVLAMATAFQAADRRVGGGALYGQVVGYLNAALGPRLLGSTDAGGELFTAAAALTGIAGWMAHDSGRDPWAKGHFASAYRLAVAARHNALTANACASMSHLATQLGQPDDAVRIAAAGLSRAGDADGCDQLQARLHAMRARGSAAGWIALPMRWRSTVTCPR